MKDMQLNVTDQVDEILRFLSSHLLLAGYYVAQLRWKDLLGVQCNPLCKLSLWEETGVPKSFLTLKTYTILEAGKETV